MMEASHLMIRPLETCVSGDRAIDSSFVSEMGLVKLRIRPELCDWFWHSARHLHGIIAAGAMVDSDHDI